MQYMDNAPFQFITQSTETDYDRFVNYVHRTFNGTDCIFFLKALKNIYLYHGGLEALFSDPVQRGKSIMESILYFRFVFFELPHPLRTEKHIANPAKNASAKRLNMYLRWMVRNDNGIDFGLWKSISPSLLLCPLDLHTGNVARKLGLLQRKSNDWKAVEELTANLRRLDPEDPVKYDISLFGLGIYEKF